MIPSVGGNGTKAYTFLEANISEAPDQSSE